MGSGVGGKHSTAACLFQPLLISFLPWANLQPQLQDLFAQQQTNKAANKELCVSVTSPTGGWGVSESSTGRWYRWHLGSSRARATLPTARLPGPLCPPPLRWSQCASEAGWGWVTQAEHLSALLVLLKMGVSDLRLLKACARQLEWSGNW